MQIRRRITALENFAVAIRLRKQKEQLRNVYSFISGEVGGMYKLLQLVEKHSLELVFVLGTNTKHQCK